MQAINNTETNEITAQQDTNLNKTDIYEIKELLIALGFILLFILILYLVFKKYKKANKQDTKEVTISEKIKISLDNIKNGIQLLNEERINDYYLNISIPLKAMTNIVENDMGKVGHQMTDDDLIKTFKIAAKETLKMIKNHLNEPMKIETTQNDAIDNKKHQEIMEVKSKNELNNLLDKYINNIEVISKETLDPNMFK